MTRPWTVGEERALVAICHLGLDHVAAAMQRSPGSVKAKARELRARGFEISLVRRPGRIPEAALSPEILARVAEAVNSELCPRCCRHPIGVKRSGLCGPCHLDALADAHAEELDRLEAQRRLWTIRQRLKRARDEAATA